MDISNQELLELATRIERDGQTFYTELAKHITDLEVREFILAMAKEEVTHEIQFIKMLEEKKDQPYGWEQNESLRALIDSKYQTDIFPRVEEIFDQLPKFEGIRKALDFAVEAEKISGEFYSLMQEACTNMKTKTLLLLLEKAEQDHLDRMMAIRERYLAEPNPGSS